jgi:hypothetical protein
MPHPPQLPGSLLGFTHFASQQSRAAPHAGLHAPPPELPPPELVPPELPAPELLPLELAPLEPPEPAPLDALLLEPPLLEPLLPELPPEPSADASSPGRTTNAEPPQCKAAAIRPTNPIGK